MFAQDGNGARNPHGPEMPFDPDEPTEKKRVQKGGSFLCTDQYCTRYIVGTRQKASVQLRGRAANGRIARLHQTKVLPQRCKAVGRAAAEAGGAK
jgi:hypothetical protein